MSEFGLVLGSIGLAMSVLAAVVVKRRSTTWIAIVNFLLFLVNLSIYLAH